MSLLRSLVQNQALVSGLKRPQPCNAFRTIASTSSRPLASSISRTTRQSPLSCLSLGGGSQRHYASKSKPKTKSTENFVPGSQQKIQDEEAQKEYAKAEGTMKTAVEWFKKECAGYETRASGRVTPAILSPVRVTIPDEAKDFNLEELATVGVREGTTLLITMFEDKNTKYVESALHSCGIPGVVPHKHDARTIKVVIPKPTVDARLSLYTAAKKKAEEIRTQVRKQHSNSLKRGKYEKRSVEVEEFQKLTDKYIGEIDKILKELQKVTGGK